MYRFVKAAVVVLCCVVGLGLSGAVQNGHAADSYKAVKAGDIPGIDSSGLLKLIAAEKGKVVIVNIFASWCPPCREEVPGLIKVRGNFPKETVVVIGVSADNEPKALVNFMNEFKINYPVKLAQGDFVQKVGVTAVPQLLIYNKGGELVVNHKGLVDEEDLTKAVKEIMAEK